MKKMMYLLFAMLLTTCTPDEDLIAEEPAETFSGDYIGFVAFRNVDTERIHSGQVYVKVDNIDGSFFVTTIDPNYEISETGFGKGQGEVLDTTFITEKDTAGISQIIDTVFTQRMKMEEVQINSDKMDWSATIKTITRTASGGTTTYTVSGRGELQKTN